MKKFLFCALSAFLVTTVVAEAQNERPDRQQRREQRQAGNENLTPEQRRENFQSRMQERLKSMTPEQRTQFEARRAEFQKRMTDAGIDPNDPEAMNKARASGLFNGMGGGQGGGRGNRASSEAMKQMMEAAGITDFDVQDAIVAYVAEQNKARATLFQLAQTAASALQTPIAQDVAADAGDAQRADEKVAATFSAYQTALAAEKARQETALKALDEKIHYSTTPRIKSFLTLVGILDNDVLALGGPAAIFPAPATAATAQDVNMQP